jgi:hypothetical protein
MSAVMLCNNITAGSGVTTWSINRGTVCSVGFTLRLYHSADQVELVEWSERTAVVQSL